MDRLEEMETFVSVVETQSFSGAAARLGVARSVVSRRIRDLEDRLGAKLINRTTRRLSLTEPGQTFHGHCLKILNDIDVAEASLRHLNQAPRGTLRLNAPMSFGILHLAPAISDFLSACPDLRVSMDLTDRFVDLVDEGYDAAVRIADLPSSTLIARRLAPSRRILTASPDYLERRGTPDTPADLLGHDCLLYNNLTVPGTWVLNGPQDPVTVRVESRLDVNNGDVLREATIAGLGISYLPTFLVYKDIVSGALRQVLPTYSDDSTAIFAVYPETRLLAPKVRVFVDFMVARFRGHPYWDQAIDAPE